MSHNNKQKISGSSLLKVKPKKHTGFIKQLSHPFFVSNKKNKTLMTQEPVQPFSAADKEERGSFSIYDDTFLFNRNADDETVFHLPESAELEPFLKFNNSPVLLTVCFEKCSSIDSGYMSPPCLNDILSSACSAPFKGILKKNLSPDIRSESPFLMTTFEELITGKLSVPDKNGPFSCKDGSVLPIDKAMSPPRMASIENALGFLDDVIDQENGFKKSAKKSVSFEEMADVKNYYCDSDNSNFTQKSVCFGEMENIEENKFTTNKCTKAFKNGVSFEDIHSKKEYNEEYGIKSAAGEDFLDVNSENTSTSIIKKSEGAAKNIKSCGCDTVCLFNVEVKVINIQPQARGQGQNDRSHNDMHCTIAELGNFNISICHHPGCTKENENRPMLLCKDCDSIIHQQLDGSGHLVVDMPKGKNNNARFVHTNSTPLFSNNLTESLEQDIESEDEGIKDASFGMNTDTEARVTSEMADVEETKKKLKRNKTITAKRRHTTGTRSHSASDIFSGPMLNCNIDEIKELHFRYHGSIDENTLANEHFHGMSVDSNKAVSPTGKGLINHETFTLNIHNEHGNEDIEIVAAEKNVCLRESIRPILERRGMSLDDINLFVEASKTPLPLTCDTFLLGGTTMYIKHKDGDSTMPVGSQSLSKATGSKFVASGKNPITKSKSGMSRRESLIGRAQSMLETPISKQRRSSLQLPFHALFPSPKFGDCLKLSHEENGSLRSCRGSKLSIDDTSLPFALSGSVSPQGTVREVDNRKQKQPSKLTTLFSPLYKDKEKQEQLNDLLNSYSTNGLPLFPTLMKIGQSSLDESKFEIEENWRLVVHSSEEELTKQQHDQQEAIWELLQTEIQYIRSIRVISDVFLCVLLNLQNELILNEIETEQLFNNIEGISAANSDFWCCHLVKVLEESRSSGKPLNPSLMKEAFQKYRDIFHPYIQYCAKQKKCRDYMMKQYAENELFKTFVIWAEAQKQCNRLKLTDLLVKPMQRLTKYSLLLQAVLRKTEDDVQRADLEEMIGHVTCFVHDVNATLHQKLEEEKLREIVDKIDPYEAADAPNDECLKLLQPYNNKFKLIDPMPGCLVNQTRTLVMQSPLKMKEYQNRMDVECLLFTDLMLICKANKKMEKYKIVKPPMRVDRIITHELKDKGSFLLIYVNEYHVPVSSFTFHADHHVIQIWLAHIHKAQEMYQKARMPSSGLDKPSFPASEIISEDNGYRPIFLSENSESLPLFQLTHCSSEEHEGLGLEEVTSSINRSRSWNEKLPKSTDSLVSGTNSADTNEDTFARGVNPVDTHVTVQYSRSDPMFCNQFSGEDKLQASYMSVSAGASESDMSIFPEFIDDSNKHKLYQRRQCHTEKRYFTADAIQELNKDQNRDNSIYKRLSWNFPNGEAASDKQGVLKHKTASSDSVRSYHSSSGVSSTCSLHLSHEGDICEEECDLCGDDNQDMNRAFEISHDINKNNLTDPRRSKSKSTPDIVSLLQEMNIQDMKDGIGSVNLPFYHDSVSKLTPAQLLRMKKQFLLSSNVEASEV